jgi:hypothetical protein
MVMLVSFALAQKFWDDVPLTNVDFAQLMELSCTKSELFRDYRLSVRDVNAMELAFLNLIGWHLHVTNPTYLMFHFELGNVAAVTLNRKDEVKRRVNSERYVVELGAKQLFPSSPRISMRRAWRSGEQEAEKSRQGGGTSSKQKTPWSSEQVCRSMTGGRAILS